MKIAAAQIQVREENIAKNLEEHYRWIKSAAVHGAQLIVFPEMSVTGYEREKAASMAFHATDKRLDGLRELSAIHNITIVAGAPILLGKSLYIGSFIVRPDGTPGIYTKQFLHDGEEQFFQSSVEYNPLIGLSNERLSIAVCADIDHPEHVENAAKNGATIYLPSIFFTPNGIAQAHDRLGNYAGKYNMAVLMSNFSGECYGLPAAGRTAFWDNSGTLVGELEDDSTGILIAEKQVQGWTVHKIEE